MQTYDVTAYIGETHSITIPTTADHTGKTLVVVWEPNTTTTDAATVVNDNITTTSTTIAFARPDLGTTKGKYHYAIRDTSNGDEVIVKGVWNYARSAAVDA